jgi:hypothetical protein
MTSRDIARDYGERKPPGHGPARYVRCPITTVPEFRPADVSVTLRWRDESGVLVGHIEIRNVSSRAGRLTGKPWVEPVGTDGTPLLVQSIVTLEARLPGYVVLQPGERARARVSWTAWGGAPASGRAFVHWPGGAVEVEVDGPAQPARAGADDPTNLTSSSFDVITGGE